MFQCGKIRCVNICAILSRTNFFVNLFSSIETAWDICCVCILGIKRCYATNCICVIVWRKKMSIAIKNLIGYISIEVNWDASNECFVAISNKRMLFLLYCIPWHEWLETLKLYRNQIQMQTHFEAIKWHLKVKFRWKSMRQWSCGGMQFASLFFSQMKQFVQLFVSQLENINWSLTDSRTPNSTWDWNNTSHNCDD